jgi:hypothetical protein
MTTKEQNLKNLKAYKARMLNRAIEYKYAEGFCSALKLINPSVETPTYLVTVTQKTGETINIHTNNPEGLRPHYADVCTVCELPSCVNCPVKADALNPKS